MRRGLVRAGAWAGATAAAVSVSWFGVHRVLRDASFEQPHSLVVAMTAPAVASSAPPLPTAIGSATQSASPSVAATTPTPRQHGPTPTPSRPASSPPAAAASPSPGPSTGGQVQSFTRPGGRIAVSMGPTSASLVSATPDPGWSMHVWTGTQWLRVDFEQGTTDSIFYVTWNGHPPLVQTWGG
ncbi:hypothetical protein [Streptacidiphilus sp. MAP12-16]|uniref:hypothetical protein n=1 Tax=Streptacidiphilus sp. MAP12-16 TaxID=3156300 RepID=UPI003517E910